MTYEIVPNGAGAFTEWTDLSGAPTHWQAAADGLDGSYIASNADGARDAFTFGPLPGLAIEDKVTAVIQGWIAWGGNPLAGNAQGTVFVRAGGIERDLGVWSVPTYDIGDPTVPGPIVVAPDLVLPVTAGELLAGAQVGIRKLGTRRMRLHGMRAFLTVQKFSDSRGFVGGMRGRR